MVTFKSSAFQAELDEEELINPGRHGRRLAKFMREQLTTRGWKVREPYAEDWGFRVEIDHPAFDLWLGCGNVDDSPGEYLVFIEPQRPFILKFPFKKISTVEDVTRLREAVRAILEESPECQEVTWE